MLTITERFVVNKDIFFLLKKGLVIDLLPKNFVAE